VALQDALHLDKLVERSRVHTGLLVALGLAVALWVLLQRTTTGFEIRAVGANPGAAGFAGAVFAAFFAGDFFALMG
jgi:simple sugar transport system permease protein